MPFSNFATSRFRRVICAVVFLLISSPAFAQDRVRVSDADAKKALINRVEPAYPSMARQMKIAGHVLVEVAVDAEGNVEKVDVVSGNTLLASSCVSAVKQWKFTPFTSGGKSTPAVARLGFSFNL